MAKKELNGNYPIPNIGVKQGSWYFPLMLLFLTICAAAIAVLLGGMVDILEISMGLKTILILILAIVLVLYIIAAISIFIEWYKNTVAIKDQEIAKSQILFLEAFRRAKALKPGAVLYDETEWVHDLARNFRKQKQEKKSKK